MQDQDHILQVMKEASSILAILSKNNTYLVGFHRKQIWDIAKTGLKVRWIQSGNFFHSVNFWKSEAFLTDPTNIARK